jgi:hypothetical protein
MWKQKRIQQNRLHQLCVATFFKKINTARCKIIKKCPQNILSVSAHYIFVTLLRNWMKQRSNLEFMLVHTHMCTFTEHHIFIQQQNSDSCKWPTVCTILFLYMFIPNLCVFRALMCSSSGELCQYNIWYMSLYVGDHLVCIPAYQTFTYRVTYIRCHIDTINSICTILFSYMFIPNLYMFWALMCSSSGELIVSIWHLVYVTM